MSRQQIGPIWPFSASIVWCTVCKSRRAWELFAMTTERPKARFKPPCRASAIRALVESRGEITRAELLEWARDGGWIEEGREGRERLYQALHSMRTVGTIDFDESGVRPGNPAKAKNLSRQKEVIRKKFSELSRMAIASLVQSLNGRSSTAASLEFAGEGVAL
ncbi:MAG: hypothetical protein O9972_39630 [Burkholderiales bacterium]|nr:hypothetical protein [Burkholderiales bacterium]